MNSALSLISFALLTAASSTPILNVSQAQWRSLNSTVGGRLHTATPFAQPCFSVYNNHSVNLDERACAVIQANYNSPQFRVDSFSANMFVEFETCMKTGSKCLLDPTDLAAIAGQSCDQGEIPPYYIEVQTAGDIQAAFKFSQETKVPLSIKNSGHDLFGRSRRRDSLGLWTRNLQTMSYEPSFVAEGCKGSSHLAITTGAGVTLAQVYQFADQHDSTFIGGYSETVGASGGWLMGGGHSVLSPTLGLGVDRVLEIKIVTPDGQLRTANACQNTDLFWALRGGGGGTFGVVIESTHLVEKSFPLQVINMTFAATPTNLPEYFGVLVNNSVRWADEGWGGHINNAPAGIAYVNSQLSLANATASMAPVAAFAAANNGTATLTTFSSWFDFFTNFVTKAEVPVGGSASLGSRLMPKTLYETDTGRRQLVAHLVKQTTEHGMPAVGVVTPISFKATPNATAVTPAWRNSLWHLELPSFWAYNSTPAQVSAGLSVAHDFVQTELVPLAPDSGSYMNEGDVYESNHEVSYWGPNYPRLLEIKNKYDPKGLLSCWRCVGWTSPNPTEYPCYPTLAAVPNTPT
ncbi:FAD-binding domain-containing protein [Mycena alexandri]|uniref:FAD-binding domain-containing protein n=1 Tax=Mycena alexandri TaxID=1745969 RepID=A0AAD6SAW8_9AGAR|nr:FAD-binding domain-containing protein [Mycena alexandri]